MVTAAGGREFQKWFREVTIAYTPRLLHFAQGRFRSQWIDAEDVVQEVWMQVFQAIESGTAAHIETEQELTQWLFRLTRDQARTVLRRSLRRRRRRTVWSWSVGNREPVGRTPTIRSELARRWLLAAVDRLPPLERDVVLLHGCEGLPFSEVAAVLGRAVTTVKTSWYRAVKKLLATAPPEYLERVRSLLAVEAE